jgi:cobalt-zinc-cadmium efflux system outer membrane protein
MFRLPLPAAAFVGVAVAASLFCPTNLRAQPSGSDITLDAAIRSALADGPDVAVERARIGLSQAALRGAEVFPTNPGLSLGVGGRADLIDGPGLDAAVGAEQALPLFGRWGRGIDAANAQVKEARLDFKAEQNRVARSVALAYVESQRFRGLLDVADKRLELQRGVVHATERRLAAGDGTLLDVTLWEAELGQAEGGRAQLEAEYARSRILLAVLLGVRPDTPPTPGERLSLSAHSELINGSRDHPDVVAQRQAVDAAKRRVEAEQANAWPDLTVSAGVSAEGAGWRQSGPAGEVVGGAGVSIPLPIFERNQGAIAAAKAGSKRERAELARTRAYAEAEVASADAAVAAALRAAEILKTRVVDKQAASLALLTKAYDAGKLGVTDVLLRQRSVLDAETAYVTALADLASARVRLASASGSLSARLDGLR